MPNPRPFLSERPVDTRNEPPAHREEIQTFANAIASSPSDVEFFSLTYSELLQAWTVERSSNCARPPLFYGALQSEFLSEISVRFIRDHLRSSVSVLDRLRFYIWRVITRS
jgi:hypothetical protein